MSMFCRSIGVATIRYNIPVVPARGGAEVALKIYIRPFSSIELACALRQPSRSVRALCETGVVLHMSHLKLHVTLHTWQSSHFTLHPSQSTLHTSHFTLHSPQSTLHTPHFTLHSPHFTLLTSHCFLHTPHFTLHTALFTPHTSHCTLHTPHFISSELFSPYPSSSLLISSLLICHLRFHESLPSTTTKALACAVRQPGSRRQSRKKTILKHFLKNVFKRKIAIVKIAKICCQITFAALMQPFQYDLRSSAAKDNSITHAAAAPSNLDAATTMRSAETELQNTIELRAMASEIAAPNLDAKATKRRFWNTF